MSSISLIDKNGKPYIYGSQTLNVFDFDGMTNVKKLTYQGCKNTCSPSWIACAIKNDGTVFYGMDILASGINSYQTISYKFLNLNSHPNTWTNIVDGASSMGYFFGLRSDGTVARYGYWTDGYTDSNGSLVQTTGYPNDNLTDSWTGITKLIPGAHNYNQIVFGIKSNGSVVAASSNNIYGQCNTSSWINIVDICSNNSVSMGLRSDGYLYVCGDNTNSVVSTFNGKTGIKKVWTAPANWDGDFITISTSGVVTCRGYYATQSAYDYKYGVNGLTGIADGPWIYGYSAFFLRTNGTVAVAGSGYSSNIDETGIRNTASSLTNIRSIGGIVSDGTTNSSGSSGEFLVCVDNTNNLRYCGASTIMPVMLNNLKNIYANNVKQIWCGSCGSAVYGLNLITILTLDGKIRQHYWNNYDATTKTGTMSLPAHYDNVGTLTQIGDDDSYGIDSNGTVYFWNNRYYNAAPNSYNTIRRVVELKNCQAIWDCTAYTNEKKFVAVPEYPTSVQKDFKQLIRMQKGSRSTVATLYTDGTVFSPNSKANAVTSTWIDVKKVITDIANSGYYTTFGVKADGTLLSYVKEGSTITGIANAASWTGISEGLLMQSYSNSSIFGVKTDGTIVYAGNTTDTTNKNVILSWTNIKRLYKGKWFIIGLKKDGTCVSTSFENTYNAHNFGESSVTGWTNIKTIVCVDFATFGLKYDGTIVFAGTNFANIALAANATNVAYLQNDYNDDIYNIPTYNYIIPPEN